jgi:hypothetical protein
MLTRPADDRTNFPFPIHRNYHIIFLNMVDNKMQQTIDQSPATHEFDYDFIPQFPSTAIFTSLPLAWLVTPCPGFRWVRVHCFHLHLRPILPDLDQVEARGDNRVKHQIGVCISFPIIDIDIALFQQMKRRRRTRTGAGGHSHQFLSHRVAHDVPKLVLSGAPKEQKPIAGIQEDHM